MDFVELIHLLKAANREAVATETVRSLQRQYRKQCELVNEISRTLANTVLDGFPIPSELLEKYRAEHNKIRELNESIAHAIDVELCTILANMRRNVADEMLTFAGVISDYKQIDWPVLESVPESVSKKRKLVKTASE